MEDNVRRIRKAALVLCLFTLYWVLLSQGPKANALSTFFGALAAVPLTVHLYSRVWSAVLGTPQSDIQQSWPKRRGFADSESGPSSIPQNHS
jgi:hypothetical protein